MSRKFFAFFCPSLKKGLNQKNKSSFKVHIFWEGHKILRNLPLTFDCLYCGSPSYASNEAGCLLIRHNECRQQYFLIFNFLLVSLLKARWIKTCENKKIGNNERSICIAPYITSYLMWSWMLYKPGKWLRSKKLSNFHSYFAWNSIETSALSRVKSKTKS